MRDLRPLYGLLFGVLLSAVLYLPLIGETLHTLGSHATSTHVAAMREWTNPLRMARELLSSVSSLGPFTPIVVTAAMVTVVVGAVAMFRNGPLLVAIYALHVPFALGAMWALGFEIWPRYFLIDIGFIML